MREFIINKKYSMFYLLLIVMSLSGCSRELIIEKVIRSGGDEEPYAILQNNRVENLAKNETAVFFRAKGSLKHYYVKPSPETIIFVGRPVDYIGGVELLNADLSLIKSVSTDPRYHGSSVDIDMTSFNTDQQVYYFLRATNVGTIAIPELTIVDALPEKFKLDSVDLFTAPFYKHDDFDKLVWETKDKSGVTYFILKAKMSKAPLGGTSKNPPSMMIRLSGKLDSLIK